MNSSSQDQFFIAAALAGDEEAFGKLYDKYVAAIYRFIAWRVRDRESAEDLTSNVFLKTWQYVSSGTREIENVRSLLYRIASNAVIDYYRERASEATVMDEGGWQRIIDESIDIANEMRKRDDWQRTLAAIDRLATGERELIFMRYIDDLSIKEMAVILGKTSGAVRVGLHRAVKALKLLLREK